MLDMRCMPGKWILPMLQFLVAPQERPLRVSRTSRIALHFCVPTIFRFQSGALDSPIPQTDLPNKRRSNGRLCPFHLDCECPRTRIGGSLGRRRSWIQGIAEGIEISVQPKERGSSEQNREPQEPTAGVGCQCYVVSTSQDMRLAVLTASNSLPAILDGQCSW
jgi:hypothetical protein